MHTHRLTMRSLSTFSVVAAFAISGCSSSAIRTYSDSAQSLRVTYGNNQGGVVEALLERGCVATDASRYRCTVDSESGPVVVALAVSQPVTSDPARARGVAVAERPEATTEYVTERLPEPERYLPEGATYSVAPDQTSTPTLPQNTSAGIPLGSTLRVWARVLDGDRPVQLVGDGTEAIQLALRGLLIEQLPVIRAEYVD